MFQKNWLFAAIIVLFFASGCIQPPAKEQSSILDVPDDEEIELVPVGEPGAVPNPAPIPGNCDAMETQFSKDTCVLSTALEESSADQCSNLSEIWMRNNCYSAVAMDKLDTSVCSRMESAFGPDNTNVKNTCIAEVALGALYSEDCLLLKGTEWEQRCSADPAKAASETCIQLEAEAWEQACWGKVKAICSQILSQDGREFCLKKSAIDAGSMEKCLELHGFEKDTCLEEVAIEYQKTSMCDAIEDAVIKQSCLERASLGPFHDVEPLTQELCEELEGRAVNTASGADCLPDEEDIGEISDMPATYVCCAPLLD